MGCNASLEVQDTQGAVLFIRLLLLAIAPTLAVFELHCRCSIVKLQQEEYDRQLSEALSRGCSVDEALTLLAWTKVVGEKKKGRLYGAGNLAGNYRKGVATTLKLTLNVGEGSSRQPELTPEMRDMITRLTQEQLAAHMQTQQDLIHEVSGSRESVRAPPVCADDADDPYEVYGEGEDDDDDDDGLEMDD
ncbi:transmembrane protein, putative [Medicago truncatula]|uniref:Transmembrane protein, putative n=1 Tax=Medicago truncatula TaxID=3880 RepID=A0A072VLN8_MEDTR|nr:transmembrane protein, putative [Medicago truncatula]